MGLGLRSGVGGSGTCNAVSAVVTVRGIEGGSGEVVVFVLVVF
jgi:hypothetical protein